MLLLFQWIQLLLCLVSVKICSLTSPSLNLGLTWSSERERLTVWPVCECAASRPWREEVGVTTSREDGTRAGNEQRNTHLHIKWSDWSSFITPTVSSWFVSNSWCHVFIIALLMFNWQILVNRLYSCLLEAQMVCVPGGLCYFNMSCRCWLTSATNLQLAKAYLHNSQCLTKQETMQGETGNVSHYSKTTAHVTHTCLLFEYRK